MTPNRTLSSAMFNGQQILMIARWNIPQMFAWMT
jgi:hypothetical protein